MLFKCVVFIIHKSSKSVVMGKAEEHHSDWRGSSRRKQTWWAAVAHVSSFLFLLVSLQAGGAASGSDAHTGGFVPAGPRVSSLSPAGGSPVTGNTRTYSN